ncbi:MAG: DUF3618 domain-containing protein [Bifidobacteriaceae bacterium]|jgi:hypothetical protein|nr:DUF3618 domain-containing protein [Bifidobacteriaceae bacterium]
MDKPSPAALAAELQAQQAALTETIDRLKERLKPAALASEAKTTLVSAAKSATLQPDGRIKVWVMVSAAALAALVAIAIARRVSGRRK